MSVGMQGIIVGAQLLEQFQAKEPLFFFFFAGANF
jgi:hypothetical protein